MFSIIGIMVFPKKNILIPKNIKLTNSAHYIQLTSPKATIIFLKNSTISMVYNENLNRLTLALLIPEVSLKPKIIKKYSLYVMQLKRSLKKITFNFFIQLDLIGIGYKFLSFKNNNLKFRIGFCNIITFVIPLNITILLQKTTKITLYSGDLPCLKQVTASLKKVRNLDNYKGKGLLFLNEKLQLKENTKKQL